MSPGTSLLRCDISIAPSHEDDVVASVIGEGVSGVEVLGYEGGGPEWLLSDDPVHSAGHRITIRFYLASDDIPRLNKLRARFPDLTTVLIQDEDWSARFQAEWTGEVVSPTLRILPPWGVADPQWSGETLRITPGLVFGTGGHETTKLCLRQIEEFRGRTDLTRFLDVGSGSGILCLLARRLFAAEAVGVDIDEASVDAATRNAALNHINGCLFFCGSVADAPGIYDVVVANLLSPIVVSIWPTLMLRVRKGGTLFVSGLLTEEIPAFESEIHAHALSWKTEGEWALGVFSSRPESDKW